MNQSGSAPADRVPPPNADLEVKDAYLIFNAVWADLVESRGRENLHFPREFIWLGGAPGAGKGTNTPFIAEIRDISAPPVVVSSLLSTPQAVAIKNAGKMVGDREVVGLLFEELLKPEYRGGCIIDGFPRTKVQVECLKLIYHAMIGLHNDFRNTPHAKDFRKPHFHIALLFVSEEVSVRRQLKRGREIQEHNAQVRATGVGKLQEERATDFDTDLCRKRYQTFKESTFEALQSLRQIFHFHFIDAEDDLPTVQRNIVREFTYQSSLELSHEVYDAIRGIPVASELTARARQELVERLEGYAEEHRPLLEKVVSFINTRIIPTVRAHATTGQTRINSEDDLLHDPLALRMMIDVFAERGFRATVDIHQIEIPQRFDLQTGAITCRTKRVYRISVRYTPSDIRRGH